MGSSATSSTASSTSAPPPLGYNDGRSDSKTKSFTPEFLVKGSKKSYVVTEDKEAVYARVDMPGVNTEGLKIWMNEKTNRLCFESKEEDIHSFFGKSRDEERTYRGSIPLPAFYHRDQIKNVLRHGVLRVKIPKASIEDMGGDLIPVYGDVSKIPL